jgi:hypothetical protein
MLVLYSLVTKLRRILLYAYLKPRETGKASTTLTAVMIPVHSLLTATEYSRPDDAKDKSQWHTKIKDDSKKVDIGNIPTGSPTAA